MKFRSLVAASTIIGLLVITACSPSELEAERAAAEASQSEVVTESTEPTESTDFGQDDEVVVGSDYMDPNSANSWVEIKNRSTWPVTINASDYYALSHKQTLVLKPGEELRVWGSGSSSTQDVYVELGWCLDPQVENTTGGLTEGSCEKSTPLFSALSFARYTLAGSFADFSYLRSPPRPAKEQDSERVGKGGGSGCWPFCDEGDYVRFSTQLATEDSRVYVPNPTFPDLNTIQFYVSRRQDKSGVQDRKITRFRVIIEDLGSWPTQ